MAKPNPPINSVKTLDAMSLDLLRAGRSLSSPRYQEAVRWAQTFLDGTEHWSVEDRWARLCQGVTRILEEV